VIKEGVVPLIALTRGSLSTTFKLAEKLSKELNCTIAPRETVIKHAEKYGMSETGMGESGFMEKQPPQFWDRHAAARRQYLIYMKASLMDFVVQGNVVYCGHLGQFLLSDVPRLLRVKVEASMDKRIAAVVKESGLAEVKAREYIEDMDSKRKSWAKFLYGVDFNDPLNYDMILNLDKMSLDSMTMVIACAVDRPEYKLDDEARKTIDDVHLKSIVLAALARSSRTRGMDLAVECDSASGRVKVSGMAPVLGSTTWEGDIEEVVTKVDGVSSVEVTC
jgi:cytidylate kinase